MCSLLFDSSGLLGKRSLQKLIRAVMIFCSKKLSSQYWQFFSFCSWLPDIPWVFISLKDSAAFLGLIMHFLFVIGTWDCFFISVFFLWNFMCISDAVFLNTSGSIFDHSVWLILSFWCANFYFFIQFYWGSCRCTSEFALDFFVSIKLSQIGSFH